MKNKKNNSDSTFLINPSYYCKVLKYKSLVILLITFIFIFIGISLSQNIIKTKYKATAKLIRYDKKISMPRDVPYKFQNFNYDTALQTIRTRKNLEEVISKLNLNISAEKLYSSFEIKRGRNSDIIEIRYTHKDIQKAVEGANVLSEIFLKNFYEVQNAATKEIYRYYEDQKVLVQKEINNSALKKDRFIKKYKILSIHIQKEYKYKQLNEIELSLVSAKVLQKEFYTKVEEINKSLTIIPKEVQLKYSVRSADRKSLDNKKKELRKLKQRYTLLNPKVKKVIDEITIMEKELFKKNGNKSIPDETTYGNNPIATALKIEKSKSEIGIVSSKTRIQQLEIQKRHIQKNIKILNILDKRFQIILNELSQHQTLMNKITDRLSEVKMALESSLEDFKFLEYATQPKYAQPTYKKAVVILFGFLGFSLSIAAVLLLEFFNHSIKESFDLEKRFGIEVLGTLVDEKENKSFIKKNNASFFDEFMSLCTTFNNPIITLVGSDRGKTGKTTVINKLMYFLSHQNKKILHIQTISTLSPDIKDALLNQCLYSNEDIDHSRINQINNNTYKAYLQINEDNEYDLANIQNIEKFFNNLKKSHYHYIFIEVSNSMSNPYLFASLANFCSFVCLVCKYRYSSRENLQDLMSILQKKGIKNIKGVLNVMDKKYI